MIQTRVFFCFDKHQGFLCTGVLLHPFVWHTHVGVCTTIQMSLSSSTGLVDCATRLSSDFKLKSCPAFTGSTDKQEKGFSILGLVGDDVPVTNGAFGGNKQAGVNILVLECGDAGFAKVPQEYMGNDKYKKRGKDDPPALPLCERKTWSKDPRGKLHYFDCYTWEIIANHPRDKGDRVPLHKGSAAEPGAVDYGWEIVPGMTLTVRLWSDTARGGDPKKFREGLSPEGCDVIPAGSLVWFRFVSKGWSKWEPGDVDPEAKNKPREICAPKKGYGMGLDMIKPFKGVSWYSVMQDLKIILPTSLDASKALQQGWQGKYESIKNMISTSSGPFLVSVCKDATLQLDERPEMANEPKQIRLGQWAADACPEAVHFIDILQSHAKEATNCPDIYAAMGLLELAACAGALSVVTWCNQFRPGREHAKSILYGFPIVDTEILLGCIKVPLDAGMLELDSTGKYLVFDAGFDVAFPSAPAGGVSESDNEGGKGDGDKDDGGDDSGQNGDAAVEVLRPKLLVSKDVVVNVRGASSVLTPDFMMVGNNVQLAKGYYAKFVHPDLKNNKSILWAGYVSMVKPQMAMPGELKQNYRRACVYDSTLYVMVSD